MLETIATNVAAKYGLIRSGEKDPSLLKSSGEDLIRLIGSGKLSLSLTRIVFDSFGFDTSVIGDGLMTKLRGAMKVQSTLASSPDDISDKDLVPLLETIKLAAANKNLYTRWGKESLKKVSKLPKSNSSDYTGTFKRQVSSEPIIGEVSNSDDILATLFN